MRPGQKAGQDCVTLLGDAFHPMTPNMAQGGCTALEVPLLPSPLSRSFLSVFSLLSYLSTLFSLPSPFPSVQPDLCG